MSNPKFNRKTFSSGFTLLEMLVTITILGILATVGFGQYRTSQMKARDAQRKADLGNISRALEMYYNDNEAYPLEENGEISVEEGDAGIDWGASFTVTIGDEQIVYMKMLPEDPESDYAYCYESDGTYFRLFATIENENDSDYGGPYTCNGEAIYTYGTFSSNASLVD